MSTQFDIQVTGYEAIQAETEEEAMEKFDGMMRDGYKVLDLRWKSVTCTKISETEP